MTTHSLRSAAAAMLFAGAVALTPSARALGAQTADTTARTTTTQTTGTNYGDRDNDNGHGNWGWVGLLGLLGLLGMRRRDPDRVVAERTVDPRATDPNIRR